MRIDPRCGIRAEPFVEHDHIRIRERCMRRSYISPILMSMRDAYIISEWSLRSPNIILVPGLPISVLATRIRLSHAGTVRLIDRLVQDDLVERRRNNADQRARLIHLTGSGERLTGALLKARERVIDECVSALSRGDLDILGTLSERLLSANGFDKSGSSSLCQLLGYGKQVHSGPVGQTGRSRRRNVAR